MSWNNKVVWTEGLFLQPQHFQQQDRYWESLLHARTKALVGYGWGFAHLELDRAALELGKIQLTAGQGIFADGTPFNFPEHDPPPTAFDVPLDLKDDLVMLALPLRRPGAEEIETSDLNGPGLGRYSVQNTEVRDSTRAAGETTAVQVGRLRMRLLHARDMTDAYTALGVVRVTERRANNQVTISKSYIPPMLHVGADAVLANYVHELYGLLHQRGEAIAARLSQLGRGGVAEIADFLLLQTVNRYEPLFGHLRHHLLLHPERLYSVCLHLVGELATFNTKSTRPPEFAPYEQDALEQSFTPLIAELRRALSMVLEQTAVPIELQDRKFGVKVAIIPDKQLVKNASFVLAATAQVSQDVLRTHFPAQIKIGPVERIRDLVNLQLPGIALEPLPVAPRQIPFHAGCHYFELDRSGDLWKQLERSGGMAMHIGGEFPGLELELWAIRA